MHYYLKAKNLFIGNTTTAVAGILEIKDGHCEPFGLQCAC